MSKTVIDVDDELIRLAAEAMGTTSKKATVNQALRRVVVAEIRRDHIERFTSGDNPDLNDSDLMDAAWRGTQEPA